MDFGNRGFLYKIVRARDKRYDGRFYCGVRTTGVYCRPICPARPQFKNILFYKSAAEAEGAGFRACLRCRPDLAPHSVQWSGTGALVGRALALIARGECDEASLEEMASRLGVSDRHLRRLFDEHLGASPLEVASSKRLHLAKQLLVSSSLPVTQVAFASGYKSIRRFNDAFKEKFKVPPSKLRKSKAIPTHSELGFIKMDLPVIAPFDWEHIYTFLKNHRVEGIEHITDNKYRRSFEIDGSVAGVEISFDPKRVQLKASVFVSNPTYLRLVFEKIRDLFDTRTNPHSHLRDLIQKDALTRYYKESLGVRIPGSWDPFETAIAIILGQLISVEQARLKMKKLVENLGTKIKQPVFEQGTHLFPRPEVLVQSNLKDLGITKAREQAIKEVARQTLDGTLDLSRTADLEKTRARLLSIKGIGPWTTEMIAMRCLGDANAFPSTDLIVKRVLTQHGLTKKSWSPWNAYVALSVWKKHLEERSQA